MSIIKLFRYRKNLFLIQILTLLFGSFIFCPTIFASPKPEIKIGAVLPLSGDAQKYGAEARLTLEHALADSEVTKFQYQLLFEDDKVSSSAALSAAKKLISQDQVRVLFSNWSYGGLPISTAVKGKELTHFALAWDPEILNISKNSYLIAPAPAAVSKIMVQELVAKSVKKVVLLQFEESGAEYALDEFERAASAAKLEVVKRIRIPAADSQIFKNLAIQLKYLEPDYLVTCLLPFQQIEIFKSLKTIKYDLPTASIGQAPESEDFIGIVPSRWWSIDYLADHKQLNAIQQRTGVKSPSSYTAFYDALKAIIEIYEGGPTQNIPTASWLQEQLDVLKKDGTYLGKLSFKNRIRQSDAIQIVDQAALYANFGKK